MIEYSTAFLFMTGSVPGRPRMTSSTRLLGSAPKFVAPLGALVNIFVRVASCTWISSPTRTLYDWTVRSLTVHLLRKFGSDNYAAREYIRADRNRNPRNPRCCARAAKWMGHPP